jgi:hypothetical protein
MHINLNLHEHALVRRMTASLTGALIALSCHAVYQDVSAMVVSAMKDHPVQEEQAVTPQDDAAKVRAFAEQLKAQRAE